MKLIIVSGRTKLLTVLWSVAFIMIAVVSSAALNSKRSDKVKNNVNWDELKVQAVTAEQLASNVNTKAPVLNTVSNEKPKMSTRKEVLYTLVAAAVIGVEYKINDPNDDDQSSDL